MTMIKFTALCGVAAFALSATAGNAQATRTWVSGVGDDVNPCSRTAPCKTFAGAISKTAAGGEINCLDPGGFGAVTIIKSMTISCPYTEGGALAGGNGVVVNMPAATDVTFLRGLDIFGVNPPTNGVRFINQGTLHIEDSTIRRFNAASSQGVSFQPSGPAELYISNTTIAENGNGATGGGVLIQPTGAGGSAKVVLQNVRIQNNANNGLNVSSSGNTGAGITVVMEDSQVTGNDQGVAVASAVGTATIGMMIVGSNLSNNGGFGLVANGGVITIRVGDTTITGNATGVATAGGAVVTSFGTNRLFGNPTVGAANNGAFTGAIQPQN